MARGTKNNITGMKFGRLTAISESEIKGKSSGAKMWNCFCECGNNHVVRCSSLLTNDIVSCGKCSYSNNTFEEKDGYMVGYTAKNQSFFFDISDNNFVKQYTWFFDVKGYVKARVNGRDKSMHRLLMGTPNGLVTDHINGIKHDNRRSNLRIATMSQNCANAEVSKSNRSSSYKGVMFVPRLKKFRSVLHHNKTRYHLGYFKTEIEAARAYDMKSKEIHGEFAKLNIKEM